MLQIFIIILFRIEFPQKLYHYAYYYAQTLLIILKFTAEFYNFFTFTIENCNNIL